MKHKRRLNRGLTRFLLVAGLLWTADAFAVEDVAIEAEFDGSSQRYVQVLPPDFDASKPVDVLLALHGHGSDRWQFIRQQRPECRAVRDIAKQRGMILISPDYRASTSWMGPAAEADTRQIIQRLKGQFRVRRVMICGASMGGASALTFAVLHPDEIDGVVAMNGTANHIEYTNFQEAIQESFGGSKTAAAAQYRKRSAELWPHRLKMPVAMTTGGRDLSVPPESVLRLADALKQQGRPALLIHRKSQGHSTTYDDAIAALKFVLNDNDQAPRTTEGKPNLRLRLPPAIYGVAGTEIGFHFDNLVLTPTPQKYQFHVQCDVGTTEAQRWTVLPTNESRGMHPVKVTVTDADGEHLARASTTLHVVPKSTGHHRDVCLLIVGDSLTHATSYPNELARRLSDAGNPAWKMLGTHKTQNAAPGVVHEGYGGWTWQRFATKHEPNPDGTYRKRSSPFVFVNDENKPQLDVERYFETATDGQRPDVAFFMLGINDCFSADPEDPSAIDERIDTMLTHAETLLAAFRRASAHTDLAICITTPPNSREQAFKANYKGRYSRWGWKRIQHRLVERLHKHFGPHGTTRAPGTGRIYLVPTHLYLDPVDGYPENNGVHPNTTGYRQIGASLYCWLKWRMAQEP